MKSPARGATEHALNSGQGQRVIKRATITDVARQSGASVGTVSRVINRRDEVNPKLRQRVLKAVADLSYQPVPRKTRQPKPGIKGQFPITDFGVLILGKEMSFLHRPILGAILHGIETTGASANLDLHLASIPKMDRVPRFIKKREVAGLILCCSLYDEIQAKRRFASISEIFRFPAVWILEKPRGMPGDVCTYDQHEAGRLAVEQFESAGHRNVALINLKRGKATHERIKWAFLLACRERGMAATLIEPEASAAEPLSEHDPLWSGVIESLIDRWMKIEPEDRPTALLVPAESTISLFYQALERRGAIPGRDVSILTCGNIQPYIFGLDPAPSTVDIRAEAIGKLALTHLCWKIENPEASYSQRILIAPSLVNRHTLMQR